MTLFTQALDSINFLFLKVNFSTLDANPGRYIVNKDNMKHKSKFKNKFLI